MLAPLRYTMETCMQHSCSYISGKVQELLCQGEHTRLGAITLLEANSKQYAIAHKPQKERLLIAELLCNIYDKQLGMF